MDMFFLAAQTAPKKFAARFSEWTLLRAVCPTRRRGTRAATLDRNVLESEPSDGTSKGCLSLLVSVPWQRDHLTDFLQARHAPRNDQRCAPGCHVLGGNGRCPREQKIHDATSLCSDLCFCLQRFQDHFPNKRRDCGSLWLSQWIVVSLVPADQYTTGFFGYSSFNECWATLRFSDDRGLIPANLEMNSLGLKKKFSERTKMWSPDLTWS